jgi:succinate-semialdehyde dehydrogenase/glutarate-semialdehyde dehydrogenase
MATMKVLNPRTGEADYAVEVADQQEVAAVCTAARDAQSQWQQLGLEGRIEVLGPLAAAIGKDKGLYDALVADTGRLTIAGVEVGAVAGMLERQANDARQVFTPQPERSSAFPHIGIRTQQVPLGVVGVISPWNFPLLLVFIDTFPALLAGCAVVLKPSEVTPRFAAQLMRLVGQFEALAPVFKCVFGPGETGAELINHVDVVAFTGSARTGRLVAAAAARNFIPAFLEMGGKDPAIILADADLEATAKTVLRASVAATGQACQSLERIYVPRRLHDAFVAALVGEAATVELNQANISKGHVGPFISMEQPEIVAEHLADATAKGANVVFGGQIEDHGGTWLGPTVLTGVTHQMKVMTEETFGPVIPVMAYDTVEEAIELANDTEYGLSASVFGADLEQAISVAEQIEAGAISINDGSLTAMVHEAENDSFKQSGMGSSRMGPSGVARYLRSKALLINRGPAAVIAHYGEPDSLPGQDT